jgi:cytochrome P450
MILYFVIFFILFLYILIKLYERSNQTSIVNKKTGEYIKSTTIITSILGIFKTKKLAITERFEELVKNLGNVSLIYQLWIPNVYVNDPELCQEILKDTKTYEKQQFALPGHLKFFLGGDNVVFANGEDWKRHRRIMDPAFFRLDKYYEIFIEKTKKCLSHFEKNDGIVNDIQDMTQKLTLDVLGLSVFGKDFDSLSGKLQKDLESYNFLTDNLLNFNFIFKNTILAGIPFLDYNKKVNLHLDHMDKVIYKLVDESKEKIKNGGNPTTMLDFMVQSTAEKKEKEDIGDFLSPKELRDNVMVKKIK